MLYFSNMLEFSLAW